MSNTARNIHNDGMWGREITWGDNLARVVKIREADLYKPVHDYLEALGYDVQGEVKDCDLVAIKDDELLVVELKTSFNLKLLCQAVKRQRAADLVYIAIPKPKGAKRTAVWRDMCMLLKRLELGLITVTVNTGSPDFAGSKVEVHFDPKPFDRAKSAASSHNKKIRGGILKETLSRSGQYNVGGVNKAKIITAYREQAIFIACCLRRYGQLSPAQLKKLGTGEKTPNILRDNHYGWFCRVKRGVYQLSDAAQEVFSEYGQLARHYDCKITSENI